MISWIRYQRSDGESICLDCAYFGGSHIGCTFQTNKAIDPAVNVCNLYVPKNQPEATEEVSDD